MAGLWAGIAGFIIAIVSDFLSAGRWQILSRLGFWIAISFLVYALYETVIHSDRFNIPGALTIIGWVLLPFSFGLLIYSLFIELSFFSTYIGIGKQQTLITTGTYALVRHPGLLWFGLFLSALLLVSRSRELTLASPIWFGLDLLWVVLQDRFISNRVFIQYRIYQKETPMLLPNYRSLKRCIATLWRESK